MKFQNCILTNFEWMHGRTDGQAKSNMPLQLFQSWGHKKPNVHKVLTFLIAKWLVLASCSNYYYLPFAMLLDLFLNNMILIFQPCALKLSRPPDESY